MGPYKFRITAVTPGGDERKLAGGATNCDVPSLAAQHWGGDDVIDEGSLRPGERLRLRVWTTNYRRKLLDAWVRT